MADPAPTRWRRSPQPFPLTIGSLFVAAGTGGILLDVTEMGRDAALSAGAAVGATMAFVGLAWRLRAYVAESRPR